MKGVLQQLVNSILEASGESLTLRHVLGYLSRMSVWSDWKGNGGEKLCIIFHSRVCWNSSSTASKASGGNNMNCPEKGSFYCKYVLIGKEKAGQVV